MYAPPSPAGGPRPSRPSFEALLEGVATWVLLAALAWGALLLAAAVVEQLSRGRLAALRWTGCPRRARPLLLAAAGLLVLLPGTAQAAGGHVATGAAGGPRGEGRAAGSPALAVRSLPVPSRPVDADSLPAADPAHTVRPGDSLWALARGRLGADPGPAAVADLVDRLHDRNRAVIGEDPDLIRPGQQLRFPATPPPPEAP